ncbi:MAG: dihydrofolate reductase family protein [Candidatus Eremiobacteraeota bacterium]|nr:dihydrofolate reductase family protein [Candidatus Eremiobacteraeota bacterium]
MRKIIALTHVSLDGIMQGEGGPEEDPSNGFTYGGWATPFRSEAGAHTVRKAVSEAFDLLLGHRTYDMFAASWSNNYDSPIGKSFNKATKYVVTRSLDRLEWDKSERIDGDVVAEIRRLRASNGADLQVWGSSVLLQTLIAAKLVDEHRIWLYPVVLGKGKRLFGDGVPPRALDLVETHRMPTGVLLNVYRSAGPIPSSDLRR